MFGILSISWRRTYILRLVSKAIFKSSLSICVISGCLFDMAAFAQNLSPLQTPPPNNQNPWSNFSPQTNLNNLLSNPSIQRLRSNPSGQISPDYWNNLMNRRIIGAGTVLTGVLEDDISSKKSKAGDVFSILLSDGYSFNNQLWLPQNSKIVGTVVSASPAGKNRNGLAGSIQVSLQTLVLPDARTIPISASIEYNPAQQPTKTSTKKNYSLPVAQYGTSIGSGLLSTAGALTRQFGLPISHPSSAIPGHEFSIDKGEVLPVKLNAGCRCNWTSSSYCTAYYHPR